MSDGRVSVTPFPNTSIIDVLRRRETGEPARGRPQSAGTDLARIKISDAAGVTIAQINRELADLRAQRAAMQELLMGDKLPRLQRERSRIEGLLMSVPRDKEIARDWIENLTMLMDAKTAESVKQAADDAIAEADALPQQIREAEIALKKLRERKKVADENATKFATIRNRFDRNTYDLRNHTQRLESLEREYPPETLEVMKAERDDISNQLSILLDIQGKVESLDVGVRAGLHSQRTIRDMVNDRKRYIDSCNEARRQVQKAEKEFKAIDMEQGRKEHDLETKLQELASQIEGIKNNTTMSLEEKQEAKARVYDTRRRTLRDIEAIGPNIENKKERYARAVRSAENTLKTRIENLNDLESHLLHRVYRP